MQGVYPISGVNKRKNALTHREILRINPVWLSRYRSVGKSNDLFVSDQTGRHGVVPGVYGRDDGTGRAETGRDQRPVGRQFGNVSRAVADVLRQ